MAKKSKRQKPQSSFLDTTIFYERLKLQPTVFSSRLDRLSNGQRFASHYTAIELNLGMLQIWVKFYELVKDFQNVPDALAAATNWYGREGTTVGILVSLNARINNIVTCSDVDRYLDYLEADIANAVTILEAMIKDFIGEFAKHPLAKLMHLTRDDYGAFMVTCAEHKLVPIARYLEKQKKKLEQLSRHIDQALLEHNTQKNRTLKDLVVNAVANPDVCDKSANNQKYGDILIALDAPDSHVLISKDTAFEVLCTGLTKPYLKFA